MTSAQESHISNPRKIKQKTKSIFRTPSRLLTLLAKCIICDEPLASHSVICCTAPSASSPPLCGSGDKSLAPESRPHDSWPNEFFAALLAACKLFSKNPSIISFGSLARGDGRFSFFWLHFRGDSFAVTDVSLIFSSRNSESNGPVMPSRRQALANSSESNVHSSPPSKYLPWRWSLSSFGSNILQLNCNYANDTPQKLYTKTVSNIFSATTNDVETPANWFWCYHHAHTAPIFTHAIQS